MRARLTSSHFVGRVGELAELELAFREAAGGHPVVVLLGGESGVGKTRLVTEFEQRVAGGGPDGQRVLTLHGEAVEQSDGELPYAPLLSALRPLVRERHGVLETLSRGSRVALAALLPTLDQEGTADERHDQSSQLRLFEAMLELLDCLSETLPVALILEDMHWADRSTRTFVSFLARTLRRERVLLALTYRTDELHRRHPLRPLLSELDRLERARRIDLAPFDRAELSEALADILGDAPSEQLVERLHARSEGNPLYSEELLAAGLDGRGSAPQSLRDAFMLRIERLSPGAQHAARAIAVGRALDEPTIVELTGLEPHAVQSALREAVQEQVLVAGHDDRLAFRHALLREALYDDLLPGERGELHLALARIYEQREPALDGHDVERATTIATHYAAAGDQRAALRATIDAAVAAQEVHAYGEAADLAERALELWPRVPDADRPQSVDHVELLSLAAAAHRVSGDGGRSEVLMQTALSELDQEAEPLRYAALLARLARTQWSLNRGLEGVRTAQRALAILPDAEGGRERPLLLAWLARTRFLRGRFRDAITDGEQALRAAVAAHEPEAEVEVLNTLGMARIALGEVDEGVSCLRRAIEQAREHEDLDSMTTAYSNLADMLNLAGRTHEALATAREGLSQTPRHLIRNRDWITLTLSELSFEAGDWEAARGYLESAPSRLSGTLLIFRQLREAELALGEGDEDRAAGSLEEAEPLVAASSEAQWIGAFGALLGELRRRRGDLRGARDAVAQALDRLEVCTDDVMGIARVSAVGTRVEADIAQRARDLRDTREQRDAVARTRIHVQRLAAAAQEGGPVESAWRAVGAAELARARSRSDPKLWLKAAAEWDSIDRPYAAAEARWRAAECHAEAGQRDDARLAAAASLMVARRIGSKWLEAELTGLAERARLDVSDDDTAGTPAAVAGAQADPFGLTDRERQVLALIAQGATNRQIGASLYMAEKTASVHVSRILRKLDVRSRTQAAAVAHRLRIRQ